MKKIEWSALFAGLCTDLVLQVVQTVLVIIVLLRFQSTFLTYGWFLVTEILVSVLVGYIIGKGARGAELLNAMAYYVGTLVLAGAAFVLLPEENWTHVSSIWSSLIQVLEIAGLATGALMAKK